MPKAASKTPGAKTRTSRYARLHYYIGWWALFVFVSLGIFLETLHGFKVAWYLDVGEETRRLLWRLAHAHGTFLAVVNIAFAYSVTVFPGDEALWRAIASRCLMGATIAIPAGFFLGGTTTYEGDPGLGILLLPIGAVMLWSAVLLTALRWP